MAAGVPCVSFDFVAGPRDIIKHNEDGVIIENGTIKALAEAIDYFIEDGSKRDSCSQNAILNSCKFFKENVIKEYKILFTECAE